MVTNKSVLVGDRNEFAIEYQVNSCDKYIFGNLCLWIGNIKIGYYDEDVLLLVIKSALERLSDQVEEINREDFANKNKEDLFKQIYAEEEENGRYLISLGESFDDFSLFAFSHDKNLFFCWKLNENPFFEYGDYPKEIQLKTVPVAVFKKVLNEWSKQLKEFS